MSEKSLIKTEQITDNTLSDYLFSQNIKLSEQEKILFFNLAKLNGLNPFNREIYAIKYGNNFNVITAYNIYIKRAEQTGLLDGWKCELTKDGAKCTIHRKDFKHPFEWDVLNCEFKKETATWKTAPSFMIKKVAIAQAFRLCFNTELGGLPYTKEEIEDNDKHVETIIQKPTTEPEPETKKLRLFKSQEDELILLINNAFADKTKTADRLSKVKSITAEQFPKIKKALNEEILKNASNEEENETLLRATAIAKVNAMHEDAGKLSDISEILNIEMFSSKNGIIDTIMKCNDKKILKDLNSI